MNIKASKVYKNTENSCGVNFYIYGRFILRLVGVVSVLIMCHLPAVTLYWANWIQAADTLLLRKELCETACGI